MSNTGTFHLVGNPPDTASFSWMTQPFMPEVRLTGINEEGGRQFEVTFNQGYIFDYGAGGNRFPVTGLNHSVGEEKENFKLKISFDHEDGAVLEAGIEKGQGGFSTFQNFTAQSEIEGDDMPVQDPANVELDLAILEAGNIEELYIRENIHFRARGHIQKFDEFYTEDEPPEEGEGHGVMDPRFSAGVNGKIQYRALCADPRSGNILEISTSGNNIMFYATTGDSGS